MNYFTQSLYVRRMYEKVKDSTPPRLVHVEQRGGVANCVRLLVSIHARRPIFVRYGGAVCGYGYCWPVPGLSCAPDRARRAGNRYDSCELAVCLRTKKSTTTCSVFQDNELLSKNCRGLWPLAAGLDSVGIDHRPRHTYSISFIPGCMYCGTVYLRFKQ